MPVQVVTGAFLSRFLQVLVLSHEVKITRMPHIANCAMVPAGGLGRIRNQTLFDSSQMCLNSLKKEEKSSMLHTQRLGVERFLDLSTQMIFNLHYHLDLCLKCLF